MYYRNDHSNNPTAQSQSSRGLLLSFDNDQLTEFDVDMPPAPRGAPGYTPAFHQSGYAPYEPAYHPLQSQHPSLSRLPPIDTGHARLRTFSMGSRDFDSPHSPVPPFPSPRFNQEYLTSRPSPHPVDSFSRPPEVLPLPAFSSTSSQSPGNASHEPVGTPLPHAPSSQELLDLFVKNQVIGRENNVRKWELQCYKCSGWIATSIASARDLDQPGHFSTLESHMRGRRCKPQLSPPSQAPLFSAGRSYVHSPPEALSPSSSTASLPPWSPVSSSAHSPSPWSPASQPPPLPGTSANPFFDMDIDDGIGPPPERFSSAPPELQPGFIPDEFPRNKPGFGGACSGLDVQWPPDISFRQTFPFHRISFMGDEGELPFEIEVHERGKKVTVWSKKCTHNPTQHSPHCYECHGLRDRLEDLGKIALDAKKGTNYKYLSHDQLRELLIERNEELNKLKLQCLNLGRRLATFAHKMDDFERLIMAIATNDVPRIHAIIETAMRNGVSVRTMTSRIIEAFEGLHHTKGFTDFERDLGILIYRLGGRSLLYAMNHALNLPSLRTICNSARFIKVTPTIGPISEHEILENIKNVLIEPRRDAESSEVRKTKGGVSIIMDECALEEQACYFSHANQVGGLCQLHSGKTPLTLATHESALTIVEHLAKGKVHFGKEMAFVAAKCSDETAIYPLLCAPTCKQETWEDMASLFRLIVDLWGREAAEAVGEIWSFNTDGDHIRRKAGHEVFCKIELASDNKIFITLSNLPGLNLFTGPNLILMTFDWRHILKRICTLLRHIMGMTLDNGRIVNPVCLTRCLLLLPGSDDESVDDLLNPDDTQDVPRAILLIEAIVALRTNRAEFNIPASDVNTNSDLDAIGLLSFMLEAILNAFTLPTSSLSLQIENLSIYAHMSFVLFRKFRLRFMSNQLYGDSQTMVKNIVFTVAKQQAADPSAIVNAYNDGTDPVENHFGYTRELGGHNSGMNFKQAVERTGWACDIHGVHDRNPGLHAGHRRRNISRMEMKDHLNEHNFTGDLAAGNCHLPASWRRGMIRTMEIFKSFSHLPPDVYDIPAILNSMPGLDLLRPQGNDYYPGISNDEDRSASQTTKAAENPAPAPAPDTVIPSIPTTPANQPESIPVNPPSASTTSEVAEEEILPDPNLPIISLEEALQSEESEPAILKLEPRKGVNPNDYLVDEHGKFIHKASICRLVLNKEYVAKSKNRGERVMGLSIKKVRAYTKPTGGRPLNGSITGASFINGDLFITLIRTTTNISLAVVRCTEITVDGARKPHVNSSSIKNPKANIKLKGQILRLKAVTSKAEDVVVEDGEDSVSESGWTWLWLGSYLMGKSTMKGTKIATDAPHIITVAGHLVEPINPTAVSAHDRISVDDMKEINSTGTTWAMDHLLLRTLIVQLWKRVEEVQNGHREIPMLKDPLAGFPYTWATTGLPALESQEGTALVADKSGGEVCLYCPEVPANWRGHMGGHILRKLRKAGEIDRDKKDKKTGRTEEYNHVGESYPCGFCGRSGQAECAITLKPRGEQLEIKCNCKRALTFRYASANEGSTTTPSRNVPVICGLCPTPPGRYPIFPGIWRYNMAQHLREVHPEYASPEQPEGDPLPYKVWEAARIDREEELALGIPEFLVPATFTKFLARVEPETRGEKRAKAKGAGGGGKAKRGRTSG